MSVLNKIIVLIIIALMICPYSVAAQNGARQIQPAVKKNNLNASNIVNENNVLPRPVMAVTPREIDIGTIGPGETGSGVFVLKNMTSGFMKWSIFGVEGWKTLDNQKLSGTVEDDANYLRIEVNALANEKTANLSKSKALFYPVDIKMTAGNGIIVCRKNLSAGLHREAIKLTSAGGNRTIFLTFKIVSSQELAQINLNPERMDMGSVLQGKTVSKKLRLTNKGKEILKWSLAEQKQKRSDVTTGVFKKGKYISFVNEETRGSGNYVPPVYLKEMMDIVGKWSENDGYPSSSTSTNSIKFHFSGTGLILYFTTYPDAGNLTIYLDDKLINEHDWFVDQKEKSELLVAEGLVDSPHVVTLVNKDGRLDIEGVRILGKDVMRGPAGWINVFPYSGSTTLETEYININLNAAQLAPGFYGDNIVFNSNGGEGVVEVFAEVVPDKLTKVIDVYRYSKGLDFLFTANPQVETQRLSQNAYVKDGIAFRLFVPDTPGTTNLYRWYNPVKKDHFYHYDPKGGGKQLQGYVFEGSIGNIATSRMTNTKELYRWFNPTTGHHFYTTDPKGEKVVKKGYRFDGIAGYVR
ncbi:MAG: hypothetical protein CVU52_05080 [Deltaproteobacteria bacterium HGW-Deltaproteobacteria-10]|nr:MAG: hypothetical protein CVU52_05080 [Deltaproteobacteria bacterium HGW-Deltaproteobacteria-10]